MGTSLFVAWKIVSLRSELPVGERTSGPERWEAVRKGIPALLMPVIIIGGLRTGIFTPTEASVIACAYAFVVGKLIYRELTWQALHTCLLNAAITSAAVLFLIGASSVSGWLITTANLPATILSIAGPLTDSPQLLVAVLIVITLLLGMVLDFTPLMLILMPIVVPLCQRAGIDLVYFGVLLIMAGALGMLTPPVGNVLNVVASVAGTRIDRVARGVLPFFFAELLVLLLLILEPGIVYLPLELLR